MCGFHFRATAAVDETQTGKRTGAIVDGTDMLSELGVAEGTADCLQQYGSLEITYIIGGLWRLFKVEDCLAFQTSGPFVFLSKACRDDGGEFLLFDDTNGLYAAPGING